MLAGFNQPIVLIKSLPGQYVNGIYQDTTTILHIEGSIQPTSQNDMELLPEGRRGQETYTLYTRTPIEVASDLEGHNADKVRFYDRLFEAVHRQRWQNGIISHHKTIVVKLPDQEI